MFNHTSKWLLGLTASLGANPVVECDVLLYFEALNQAYQSICLYPCLTLPTLYVSCFPWLFTTLSANGGGVDVIIC